ncbi:hypothetical protein [Cyanobium sp. CH-040]|uniref:hypothetical protein n=1 Tax=Cyanobium sp. CH-040 TaxID=2823708 RepID=UPI0020CC2D83|nr:hypothetical protein [Cyanobium sp. CH-040]MCP9926730.1 hypothetical protein [Cyanobium sp. CH-040]
MQKLINQSPEELNEPFQAVLSRDLKILGLPGYLSRWLFTERLEARGVGSEISFEAFQGVTHIPKFFPGYAKPI